MKVWVWKIKSFGEEEYRISSPSLKTRPEGMYSHDISVCEDLGSVFKGLKVSSNIDENSFHPKQYELKAVEVKQKKAPRKKATPRKKAARRKKK